MIIPFLIGFIYGGGPIGLALLAPLSFWPHLTEAFYLWAATILLSLALIGFPVLYLLDRR